MISRINAGEIPGQDVLLLISRVENVSLSWLLDGRGSPFCCHNCETPEEFCEELSAELEDQAFDQITVVNSGSAPVVIFEQAATDTLKKDKTYDYRRLTILSGPWSKEIRQILIGLIDQPNVTPLAMHEPQVAAIRKGELGTFLLFGDEKHTGILASAMPDKTLELLPNHRQLKHNIEPSDEEGSLPLPSIMRSAIVAVERSCQTYGVELSPFDKAKAYTAVYRHIVKKGEQDDSAVNAIVEVLL